MMRRKTLTTWLVAGIPAVGCFLFFLLVYPYHNLLKEQLILFLHSPDYFLSYLDKPAWLTRYAGDMLTQCFIHPAGGAAIITVTLFIIWVLFRQLFRRFGTGHLTSSLLALIPAVTEFLFHCGLHYPLSSTFSTLLALLALLGFTRLRSHNLYLWLFFPAAALLYYLAGHGIILFTIAWSIYGILKRKRKWYYTLLPALAALAFPLLMRPVFLLTAEQAYRHPVKEPLTLKPDLTWKKILELDYESQREQWAKILLLAQRYKLHNRIASYYTNLALSQTGMMGEWLFHFYQPGPAGLFLPVSQLSTPLTIAFSNELFYRLGDMNMAQHAAMLGTIFSPDHRSSRLARRLTEVHIAIGDAPAAGKYLGLLEKTLFYRKWARQAREQLSREDIPLRAMIPSMDTVRLSDDYLTSLKFLLENNPDNTTARDYLLCFHLLNKDIPSFREAFDRWFDTKIERVPGVYAQALLVSLYQESAPDTLLRQYNIPAAAVNQFIEYTRSYEEAGGLSAPLHDVYGNTFWFYYHFAIPE